MSTYDDRDTAITRDPMPGPGYQPMPPQPQYYGYPQYGRQFGGGYGMRGMGMHRGGGSETKPFYHDERVPRNAPLHPGHLHHGSFDDDLDSHGAALFSAILVAAYTVSRGIAKAGTRRARTTSVTT